MFFKLWIDRGENLPANQALDIARTIKERWCYICKDIAKEYKKYDEDGSKFQVYEGKDLRTKRVSTSLLQAIQAIF